MALIYRTFSMQRRENPVAPIKMRRLKSDALRLAGKSITHRVESAA